MNVSLVRFFSTRGALKTQWNSSRWKNLMNAQFVKKCFLRKPSWISMFLQFMEKKKPYKCSFCEKMFSLNRTLSRHSASVHEGKKPYHSSMCGKCFSLNFQLKKHMISVHEWGEEIFPMQHLWSYFFTRKSHEETHYHSSWREKAYEYSICEKLFSLNTYPVKKKDTWIMHFFCPWNVTFFEKKCPQNDIVHKMSPSLKNHQSITK